MEVPGRITPACAGNTEFFQTALVLVQDHPRLRGEYKIKKQYPLEMQGSPPLARGIRAAERWRQQTQGITPACAGNTDTLCVTARSCRDHPRLRGEYEQGIRSRMEKAGSPPLARGILAVIMSCAVIARITPACAGNTYENGSSAYGCRDHPRLRGEYTKKSHIYSLFPISTSKFHLVSQTPEMS